MERERSRRIIERWRTTKKEKIPIKKKKTQYSESMFCNLTYDDDEPIVPWFLFLWINNCRRTRRRMKAPPIVNARRTATRMTKYRALVLIVAVSALIYLAMQSGSSFIDRSPLLSSLIGETGARTPNEDEIKAVIRAERKLVEQAAASDHLNVEDVRAGFVLNEPLPPKLDLPREPEKEYAMLNIQYHTKRQRLRQYQADRKIGPLRIHTFYTVDCTQHSLWQVLALEDSWWNVRQGGFISRVIAGCRAGSEKAAQWTRSVLPAEVESTRFGSYFAPESSTLPNGKYYAPYNRPNAIWYWLNHTDLTEQIFVLLDPDMYYTHRLSVASVERGKPAAQYYGYMEGTDFTRYKCPLCPDSRKAYFGSGMNSKRQYSVGPPWMLHVDDFRTIMPTWVQLVPMLRDIDDIWIIEMVAYAVAAAFHGLPHTLIHYGMVDNVRQAPLWDDNTDALVKPNPDTHWQEIALLHYCYTWEVGEVTPRTPDEGAKQHDRMVRREKVEKRPIMDYYHWSKYRTPTDWPGGKGTYPHNVLDCNCPLMQEIHTTNALPLIADRTLASNWRRTMLFLRGYLPGLNQAITKWKKNVLNCSIPTVEEEIAFENAIQNFLDGKEPIDPTSIRAPAHFKRIMNLGQQLRTSHPTYWISNYIVRSVSENLNSVEFEPARVARGKIFEELRRERAAAGAARGEAPSHVPGQDVDEAARE